MKPAAKSVQADRAVAVGSGGGGTAAGGGSCLEQPATATNAKVTRAATTPRWRLFLRVMITSKRVVIRKRAKRRDTTVSTLPVRSPISGPATPRPLPPDLLPRPWSTLHRG